MSAALGLQGGSHENVEPDKNQITNQGGTTSEVIVSIFQGGPLEGEDASRVYMHSLPTNYAHKLTATVSSSVWISSLSCLCLSSVACHAVCDPSFR